MKKVLILGSQGMLGSALVKELINGFEVVAWDRGDVDLTDFEAVKTKISVCNPQVIINAVALNNIEQIEKEEREDKQRVQK